MIARARPFPILLLSIVAFSSAVSQASGSPIGPATFSGSVDADAGPTQSNLTVTGPGIVSTGLVSGCNSDACATASASATINTLGLPSLSATATVNSGGNIAPSVLVEPTLVYQIEFLGPAGNVQVGVDASGATSLTEQGANVDNSADAFFDVSPEPAAPGRFPDGSAFSEIFAGQTFHDNDLTFTLDADTIYYVNMEIILSGTPFGGGSATLSANIDPQFFAPPGYTIELSPGIGNVATTPLPAALPLFATGLGAMGLLGWRRKRKNAATLA
jgi:hypothetical protein